MAHGGDHLPHENRLECFRGLLQTGTIYPTGRSSCTGLGGRGDFARFHHNITNSAFMAPACFIASNMATRSAGEAPMALTAFTMSARDAPPRSEEHTSELQSPMRS